MAVLYVASDEPGAGKTTFCIGLAAELKTRGMQSSVFKPFYPVGKSNTDPDPAIFEKCLGKPTSKWPFSQLKNGMTKNRSIQIKDAFESEVDGQDLLLVEGASDIPNEVTTDLLDLMDANILVLTKHSPDTRASKLERWQKLFGERLIGYVLTGLARYQGSDACMRLLPEMTENGLNTLGIIPENRTVIAVSTREVASHLNGHFIVGEKSADNLVESLMVGGLGLDNGVDYFSQRDNKAVVIRGDRPDIQLAALQTQTSCLVLTQGIEPIEYVKHEAEEEEVPIIVVQTDTVTTMESLNTVLDNAAINHPQKLQSLAGLLRDNIDLEAVYAKLGLPI